MLPWGGTDLMQQPAFVLQVIERCDMVAQQVASNEAEERQRKLEKMAER